MCVPVAGCIQVCDVSPPVKLTSFRLGFFGDYGVSITLVVVGTLGVFGVIGVSPSASWALIGAGAGCFGIETAFLIVLCVRNKQPAADYKKTPVLERVELDKEEETSAPSGNPISPASEGKPMFEDGDV